MMIFRPNQSPLDRCGIALAGICLFHCAALPLALIVFPLLGAFHESVEWLHGPLALTAIVLCLFATAIGRYRHGCWMPTVLGGIGILLLFSSLFEDQVGGLAEYLASFGALFVASVHWTNIRATHACASITENEKAKPAH